MDEPCDLKVLINGSHTFFLHQSVVCCYSEKLRAMVKRERKNPSKNPAIRFADFPGSADGFELAIRYCYNHGSLQLAPSTCPSLHCAAVFLDMPCLLTQTEAFMDGLFYWPWTDILAAIKSCEAEALFAMADAAGILDKLICALFCKIAANAADAPVATTPLASSSSCSSSPDTVVFHRSSSTKTPDSIKPSMNREWWFEDLTILLPPTIEKAMKVLGSHGAENKNLMLTRFLLYYLRTAKHDHHELSSLAETAVHGVVLIGRAAFSCRGLFWVHRVVSRLHISNDCKSKLERLMGLMLDQATLDDLLVSGNTDGGSVYDVNLVMRLIRVFVSSEEGGDPVSPRMVRVGRLVDKYLGEISPDQCLSVSRFLAVAQSLPDAARDCYDGLFWALDIYLEAHPALSAEERTSLCRCLNYEKLTLEACKELAKKPSIPPGIAVQALAAQQSKLHIRNAAAPNDRPNPTQTPRRITRCSSTCSELSPGGGADEKEMLKQNLQMMQSKVMELEKACKEMRGQMSKMTKAKPLGSSCSYSSRGLPRLC